MTDIHWTGLGTGPLANNYRDGGNWSGGMVPTRDDDVKLGGSGYTVNLSPGKVNEFYLHSLQINKGVTLLVHDASGQFDRDDTTLDVLGQINNKGTIQLAGGSVQGGYTDTAKSLITGYGNLYVTGNIEGKVVATQQGTGVLSLSGAKLTGKLAGAGTAELNYGVTVGSGAKITVANLVLNGATTNTDLDLTHSHVAINGSVSLAGHTVSINGAEINEFGQIYGGGTLVNSGHITAAGFNLNVDLVNNGQVDLSGRTNLTQTISGTGTITLDDGARFVDEGYTGGNGHGVVLAGSTFDLTTNSAIVFSDDADHDFYADISGLGGSNKIELDYSGFAAFGDNPTINFAQDAGGHSGTLTLTGAHDHLSLHLLGDYTTAGFQLSEGDGATFNLTYHNATTASSAFSAGNIIHI